MVYIYMFCHPVGDNRIPLENYLSLRSAKTWISQSLLTKNRHIYALPNKLQRNTIYLLEWVLSFQNSTIIGTWQMYRQQVSRKIRMTASTHLSVRLPFIKGCSKINSGTIILFFLFFHCFWAFIFILIFRILTSLWTACIRHACIHVYKQIQARLVDSPVKTRR